MQTLSIRQIPYLGILMHPMIMSGPSWHHDPRPVSSLSYTPGASVPACCFPFVAVRKEGRKEGKKEGRNRSNRGKRKIMCTASVSCSSCTQCHLLASPAKHESLVASPSGSCLTDEQVEKAKTIMARTPAYTTRQSHCLLLLFQLLCLFHKPHIAPSHPAYVGKRVNCEYHDCSSCSCGSTCLTLENPCLSCRSWVNMEQDQTPAEAPAEGSSPGRREQHQKRGQDGQFAQPAEEDSREAAGDGASADHCRRGPVHDSQQLGLGA